MATTEICLPNQQKKLLASIAITFSFLFTTSAVEFCYFGQNIKSIQGFQNQSCSSGDLHILSIFLTEQQTALTNGNDKHTASGGQLSPTTTTESTEHNKMFCYVFRYVMVHALPDNIIHESAHISYGCDFHNYCANKTTDLVLDNVTVNNQTGKLYCCSKENCNDLEKVHSPSENRICHEGMKNLTSVSKGGLNYCQHSDAVCAKSTVYLPDGKIENYFCDNENQCSGKLLLGAFQSCTNKTEANRTQELCCCDHSMCYTPPWFKPHDDLVSDNLPSVLRMDKTIEKPKGEKADSLLITGLLTVLLFVSGLGAGAVFILACKKRRKARQDPNVIMQYERLSSDIDIDEAVVL